MDPAGLPMLFGPLGPARPGSPAEFPELPVVAGVPAVELELNVMVRPDPVDVGTAVVRLSGLPPSATPPTDPT